MKPRGSHLALCRAVKPAQIPRVGSSLAAPRWARPGQHTTRSPGDPCRERASAPPAPTRKNPHLPGGGDVKRGSPDATAPSPTAWFSPRRPGLTRANRTQPDFGKSRRKRAMNKTRTNSLEHRKHSAGRRATHVARRDDVNVPPR